MLPGELEKLTFLNHCLSLSLFILSRLVAFLGLLLQFKASDEALSLLFLSINNHILFLLLRFLMALDNRFLTDAFFLAPHNFVLVNYTFYSKEKFDTRLRSFLLKVKTVDSSAYRRLGLPLLCHHFNKSLFAVVEVSLLLLRHKRTVLYLALNGKIFT